MTLRRIWMGMLAVVMSWGVCGPVLAEEYPTLFRGVRPLGMGGAFLTLSNDENALFYNPAGLNDVKDARGAILNPYGAVSENSLGFIRDLQDLEGTDEAAVADLLNQHVGEHQHSQAALFPNFYARNFAFGLLGSATMDLVVRNPANPEVVTDVKADLAGLVGVAHGFLKQTVQVGVTGKYVRREGVKKTFQAADIVVDFDPFADRAKETDFAFDIGTKVNMPVLFRPSIALVVQNIGDLDFEALGTIPQQIHLGVGLQPDFLGLSNTLAIEMHDVTKEIESDDDTYKRVHLGAEVRFPKILAVQAGVNQGYYTAGVTLDFRILTVAAATYAEEMGSAAGQRADRRYVAQITLGF
jgi:hypothetical protein